VLVSILAGDAVRFIPHVRWTAWVAAYPTCHVTLVVFYLQLRGIDGRITSCLARRLLSSDLRVTHIPCSFCIQSSLQDMLSSSSLCQPDTWLISTKWLPCTTTNSTTCSTSSSFSADWSSTTPFWLVVWRRVPRSQAPDWINYSSYQSLSCQGRVVIIIIIIFIFR